MHFWCRGRWIVLGLVLAGLVTGGPLGCGSKKSEEERGLTVGQEEAVPESNRELKKTEAERSAQVEHEMEKKETKEFDESER
jgi:hypothetical protein